MMFVCDTRSLQDVYIALLIEILGQKMPKKLSGQEKPLKGNNSKYKGQRDMILVCGTPSHQDVYIFQI